MAQEPNLPGRQLESYVDTGMEANILITLQASKTTVTVPDNAKGIRLHPNSSDCRFAVGQTIAASQATSSATTIAANIFTAGDVAKADAWETRLLPSGTGRTVELIGTTSATVIFSVF